MILCVCGKNKSEDREEGGGKKKIGRGRRCRVDDERACGWLSIKKEHEKRSGDETVVRRF